MVLRPFDDASEEAADSLTEAMHLLPDDIDWPMAIEEIRLRRDSVIAGQLIKSLDLRAVTGISIIAVSRAGKIHLDPDPNFQLFPGDRLVLMGEPGALKEAGEILEETKEEAFGEAPRRFTTAEVEVGEASGHVGHSLAEMKFRKAYGVTVIGIVRNHERIPMPRPEERLMASDRLIVIGTRESIDKIRKQKI